MKAADTSVIVASFASWHGRHEAARLALDSGLALIEHCALETYSVLTRLPPPHRASAELVRDFLMERFPNPGVRLTPSAHRAFIAELPDRGVLGGSVYDALIAATAAAHSLELVSCDARASSIYQRYGVAVELL